MSAERAGVHNGFLKIFAYLAIVAVFALSGYAAWGVVRDFVREMPDPLAQAAQEPFNRYVTGETDHDFHADDGDFGAVFPGKPRRFAEELPLGDTTATMIGYDTTLSPSVAFSVAYFEVPAGMGVDLGGVLSGGASEVGGRVRSTRDVTHAGYRAVEGLVETDEEFIRARWVDTGDRVYVVQVSNIDDPLEAYNRFVSKFTLDEPAL